MDDKTLNVPDWWPDEPIPIYHAKETLEPKQIWITSASTNPYSMFQNQYEQFIEATKNNRFTCIYKKENANE